MTEHTNNQTELTPQQQAQLDKVKLPADWKAALAAALTSDQMAALRTFLAAEQAAGKTIFPPNAHIFNAFNTTPLAKVKVVIIGQDPYHGAGQAHGLSFSVPRGMPQPPSLKNILKEMAQDIGTNTPQHGELTSWATQGVLLLNAVLTVEANRAASHQNKGWEVFTDAVVDVLNHHTQNTVFILWGSYAQRKGRFIDDSRHKIITAVHPSPLAANRGGFFGTKPFSQANIYLQRHGKTPINWQLPA